MIFKVLLPLFLIFNLYAKTLDQSDFKVTEMNGRYFMTKKDLDLKLYELKQYHGTPSVLKVIHNTKAPHLYFIVYPAGFTGTKTTASFYKAVIWNEKENLFRGEILYKVIENEGFKNKEKEIKAKWDFEATQLTVSHNGKVVSEIDY